jgi:sulfur carrier protein ThiS
MTVTVVMHGNLRRFMPGGADRADLQVPDGTTVEALLTGLGAERDVWLVARNQVVAERGAALGPGDVLDCFEPVAAG